MNATADFYAERAANCLTQAKLLARYPFLQEWWLDEAARALSLANAAKAIVMMFGGYDYDSMS